MARIVSRLRPISKMYDLNILQCAADVMAQAVYIRLLYFFQVLPFSLATICLHTTAGHTYPSRSMGHPREGAVHENVVELCESAPIPQMLEELALRGSFACVDPVTNIIRRWL